MIYSTLPPEEALTKALRSVRESTRYLICGKPDEREMLDEQLAICEESVESILKEADSVDPEEWFKEKEFEYRKNFGEDYDPSEITGDWPGKIEGPGITLYTDILTSKPLASVLVAEVTVNNPWEIPAHFKFGNWNDCPAPGEQCAIWKYWYEKYGAHIVGVSHDVIEAKVLKPPLSQEDAMQLAWEQYWYCYDIVEQGVETVSNLGACLLKHDTWYFWWD